MPARSPPHGRRRGPSGKGVPSATQKHGRSCRTSSTLQHHSHGGGPGDCDLHLHRRLAQVDSWLGQLDDDEAFRLGERWAGGGSIPVFSPSTRGAGDRFGIPNPQESGSVIGADRRRSGHSCVLPKGVPLPQGRVGYSTRRQCWATSAQRRCHPEEALYLPTFSHLFYCQ